MKWNKQPVPNQARDQAIQTAITTALTQALDHMVPQSLHANLDAVLNDPNCSDLWLNALRQSLTQMVSRVETQLRSELLVEVTDAVTKQVLAEVLYQLDQWDQAAPSAASPLVQAQVGESTSKSEAKIDLHQIHALQGEIDLLQLREEKQQQQIHNYELELEQLQQEKQILEQTIQELPEIYRQKFQARLEPIRTRIQQIQWENHRLRADVQILSQHLSRHYQPEELDGPRWPLRLPKFHRQRALQQSHPPALPALPAPLDP